MDIVLLATADWDNPLWTNKQHLASRWGRAGHRVLYVESLGLRRPELSGRDARRIWRRLRRANRLRNVAPGVWVLSPLLLPLHASRPVRAANRRWLARLVRRSLRRIGMSEPVLWTYNPLALDYLGGFFWTRVVYHCVDELLGAPGMPQAVVEEKERDLMARGDLVVVTSKTLAEAKGPLARRLEYLPNAADFAHFATAASPETRVPRDLDGIPEPRVGYIGALADYKVDVELLVSVFQQHPDWRLVLIGPVGEGQPSTSVGRLQRMPNVHLLGARRYSDAPSYLKGFGVCLLPNRLNRYTENMFPLKFFEYLATGKPVVMTRLPALEDYWHLVYVASSDAAEFGSAIERALAEPPDSAARQARVAEAREHDWEHHAQRLLNLVSNLETVREGRS
jgi:glycosyltransferase involved in cell wall biosynthesis